MTLSKVEANSYAALYIVGIVTLGYLLPRTATVPLFLVYGGCFMFFWRLYQLSLKGVNWKLLLFFAILLRLVLLFSIPAWSEDYARFLWDGHLVNKGFNPYVHTPEEMVAAFESKAWMVDLYQGMNSPQYHSVYPPLNQLIFTLAAAISKGDLLVGVVVLRLVLICFDLLAFYLIYQLLRHYRQPVEKLLIYALNPLVIMETAGNLHFEGMMLTLLLAAIYYSVSNRYATSGAALATAAAIKLSPLMLFPLMLNHVNKKALWRFVVAAGVVLLSCLAPLAYAGPGYFTSLSLYSDIFEFNASIYYLIREIGLWTVGYNTIAIWGPALKVLALVLILVASLWKFQVRRDVLPERLLVIYWIYFLLNTVVHPWYIIPALGISLFTKRQGFTLWSLTIVLSYHAYGQFPYAESGWYLWLEYGVVAWALWKDYIERRHATTNQQVLP